MISVVLAFLLAFAPSQPGTAQNAEPFSLTIKPIHVVKQSGRGLAIVGEDVSIGITLTNTSNHDITIVDKNRDCDYTPLVQYIDGRVAPETKYRQELKCDEGLMFGRWIVIILKPQEARTDELVVSRFFKMTRSGTYTVRVMRKVPKGLGEGTVKSNVVTITVGE